MGDAKLADGLILYNGASGGLGRYLAEPLRRIQGRVHALSARLEDQLHLKAELAELDAGSIVTFVHLAARVSVPACEADPVAAYSTNVELARATAEVVVNWAQARGAAVRVVYVSTGHVYAASQARSRLSEDAPTAPRSVYARTKLEAETELADLARRRATPLLIARVFGLLAPQQAANYVLPGIIARVQQGRLDAVPGLDLVRDYLDARDVCEDLVRLLVSEWHGSPAVVNVCSGSATTIRDLLHAVLLGVGRQDADEVAASAVAIPGRPDDVDWLVGDPTRFIQITGTTPQRIPLAATVADALSYRHAGS